MTPVKISVHSKRNKELKNANSNATKSNNRRRHLSTSSSSCVSAPHPFWPSSSSRSIDVGLHPLTHWRPQHLSASQSSYTEISGLQPTAVVAEPVPNLATNHQHYTTRRLQATWSSWENILVSPSTQPRSSLEDILPRSAEPVSTQRKRHPRDVGSLSQQNLWWV